MVRKAFRSFALLVCIILLLLPTDSVFGQQKNRENSFTAGELKRTAFPQLNAQFRNFQVIRLDSRSLRNYLQKKSSTRKISLRLSKDISFEMELEPAKIIADHYTLRIQTPEGIRELPAHPDYLYKGKIAGKSRSSVRLIVKDGFIAGNIMDEGKSYFIDPLRKFSPGAGSDDLVLYSAADVISDPFVCGTGHSALTGNMPAVNISSADQVLTGICKTTKFNIVADYSIYQKFNNSVEDEETALLSNLNIAEGAFTNLNLGPDNSTDTGNDMLHFEVEQMFLSACSACDIMGKSGYIATMVQPFQRWVRNNTDTSCFSISQYWTTHAIYIQNDLRVIGEADGSPSPLAQVQFLRYYTDNSASLRVLVAHETGHNLGCQHDDQRKADVTQFIMYSGADASAAGFAGRFSRLSDFGGIPYSSQLVIRNTVLSLPACFSDCQPVGCQPPTGLQLAPGQSGDSIRLQWSGTGLFKLTAFPEFATGSQSPVIEYVNGSQGSIPHPEPCTPYRIGIQRICLTDTSSSSTIVLNSSDVQARLDTVNIRDSLYDLQMSIAFRNCNADNLKVSIDHIPQTLHRRGNTFRLENLAADGSRHRLDFVQDSSKNFCAVPQFFSAPDYRLGSRKFFDVSFDSCRLPEGWTDSLIRKLIPAFIDHPWKVALTNTNIIYAALGNFDSTCMLIFDNYFGFSDNFRGASAILSPSYDLRGYRHVSLGFDYNFYAIKNGQDSTLNAFFKVEAFTHHKWAPLFIADDNKPYSYFIPHQARDIWDSIPPRVNIDLDEYISEDFRLRFIADDGSVTRNTSHPSCLLLVALDNIRLNGYPLKSQPEDPVFTVFPNPSQAEIFLRFNDPFTGPLQ